MSPFSAWACASPTWSEASQRAIMPTPSREQSMASISVRSSMDFSGAVFNPFEVSTRLKHSKVITYAAEHQRLLGGAGWS